jgi:hypothetical protein
MNKTSFALETISIATPCSADWNTMSGDERSRHCAQCNLSVHNLSAMTRAEAEALVAGSDGRICVRLYRRADGTVLTQDCPVGMRSVRDSRMRRMRSMVAAATALLTGAFAVEAASSSELERTGRISIQSAAPIDTTEQEQPVEPEQEESEYTAIMGGLMPPPEMEQSVQPIELDTAETVSPTIGDALQPGDAIIVEQGEVRVQPTDGYILGQFIVGAPPAGENTDEQRDLGVQPTDETIIEPDDCGKDLR